MIDEPQAAFFKRLCDRFEWVNAIYQEETQDGEEVLPYAILGFVAEAAIKRFNEKGDESRDVKDLMEFLEVEYAQGTESVRDIIHLGFLEGLGGPPHPYWRIRQLLGPELRRTIEEIWPSEGDSGKAATWAKTRRIG